jgi:hypothetical protein
MEYVHIDLEKRRLSELPLPCVSDFFRAPGGDEAETAWKNFGGLSLEQAYGKFMESPDCRQEDFMWMFPKAFEYYFPVLDRYLRTVSEEEEESGGDGWEVWIIGCGINLQLGRLSKSHPQRYLLAEISVLSHFVKENLSLYFSAEEEQIRTKEVWLKIDQAILELEKNFTSEQLPIPAESP